MIIEKNIMVSMPDGVHLATDIYRPETEEALPVLINRTPYDKDREGTSFEVQAYINAGYAVAIQDVRGRYHSEGDFIPYDNETEDALCFYNWIREQPWCNGKFGTFGASYNGATQWLPARRSPEGLCAMVTTVTFDNMFNNCTYQGGAKILNDLRWVVQDIIPDRVRRAQEAGLESMDIDLPSPDTAFDELPMATHPTILKYGEFYPEWLQHNTQDEFWQKKSPCSGYEGVLAPALNVGGWYDILVPGTLNNFTEMQKRGGSEDSRKNPRLIMGPWSHMNFTGKYPELDYGEQASAAFFPLHQLHIDWYNHWLKDMPLTDNLEKPVKIFVMGANEWRDEEAWPLPDTHYKEFYLHSEGHANTLNGDGSLSITLPNTEPSDSYTFDPQYPVPTVGGQIILPPPNFAGPRDQRQVEQRDDVLVYDSPVIEQPLEVTGNISAKLFVSSDCVDTDFTAKLVDVFPDGRAFNLCDGILRTRYRDSITETTLMESGQIYELTIQMGATSNVFLPGHKIRLEVASCNFPKYNRNSNTGGSICFESLKDYRPAHNTIYHDEQHPSQLILPVIKR